MKTCHRGYFLSLLFEDHVDGNKNCDYNLIHAPSHTSPLCYLLSHQHLVTAICNAPAPSRGNHPTSVTSRTFTLTEGKVKVESLLCESGGLVPLRSSEIRASFNVNMFCLFFSVEIYCFLGSILSLELLPLCGVNCLGN